MAARERTKDGGDGSLGPVRGSRCQVAPSVWCWEACIRLPPLVGTGLVCRLHSVVRLGWVLRTGYGRELFEENKLQRGGCGRRRVSSPAQEREEECQANE